MATTPWWYVGDSYPIVPTYYYDSNEVVILDHEQFPYLVTFGTPVALINNKVWYEGNPRVHIPEDLTIDDSLYNMLNDPFSLIVAEGEYSIKTVIALQGGVPATLEL